MPEYRLFYLNSENHIFRQLEHSCPDDMAALDKARALATNHAIEIWQETRRVALVKKSDEPLSTNDLHAP